MVKKFTQSKKGILFSIPYWTVLVGILMVLIFS